MNYVQLLHPQFVGKELAIRKKKSVEGTHFIGEKEIATDSILGLVEKIKNSRKSPIPTLIERVHTAIFLKQNPENIKGRSKLLPLRRKHIL